MPKMLKGEASAARAQRVLSDVLEERDHQRGRWSVDDDVLHSHCEWTTILTTWLGKAGHSARHGDTAAFRKRLVQVAAICMAAIETLDRDAR